MDEPNEQEVQRTEHEKEHSTLFYECELTGGQ